MDIILEKGKNWFKGLALFGMMAAVVGTLAIAPSAEAARITADPVPAAARYGKLNVVAVDSNNGAAIYAATIVVTKPDSDVVLLKASTDKTGQFSGYLAIGTFNVRVIADNYKEYSQLVTITSGQTTVAKADLQPASAAILPPPNVDPVPVVTVDPVPVPMRPIGKLNVVAVNSETGTMISGAVVAVYNEKGEGVFKGTTDANGYFATYIGVGAYKVVVNANGFQEFGQGVDIAENQTAEVKADLKANSTALFSR